MELTKKHKAMLASYVRSIIGASAALYAAGVTDLKELSAALIGAIIPVLLRALNPNDPAFGRMPKTATVDKALKAAKPKKKTVK
jgi:hypothetical protein